MPSGIVKRKQKVTEAQRRAGANNTIAAFGRISKSALGVIGKNELVKNELVKIELVKRSLDVVATGQCVGSVHTTVELAASACSTGTLVAPARTTGGKRKAEELEVTPPKLVSINVLASTHKGNVNAFSKFKNTAPYAASHPEEPVRPSKRLFTRRQESPTRDVQSSLEAFFLSTPSTRPPSSLPTPRKIEQASPHSEPSPCPERPAVGHLPDDVQDLVDLYSSFLTVLFIRQAHGEPTDLRNLQYGMEKAWKKRRVTLQDVQRILGIANYWSPAGDEHNTAASPFELSDYGSGKICVEIVQGSSGPSPLDITRLKKQFREAVGGLYDQHYRLDSTASFIAAVPLAQIVPCESLAKTTALHAKGQNRLADLKAHAKAAQVSSDGGVKGTPSPTAPAWKALLSRDTSLKARVAAKEAHLASLPAGPSPETVARRAALERLERVIPVLELLSNSSASQETCLFTISRVVQSMRDSGNPIGEEEGISCVRVAAECVPGWVSIVQIGTCSSVVIRRQLRVAREEWLERVERMRRET